MRINPSPFLWRGQPSEIGKTLIKTSGTTPPAKAHPMRNGTSSINTERVKIQRVKGAAI